VAKHHPKKKKTPKEPDSNDSEKKDLPPSEPLATEEDKERTNRQLKKLFWFRIALALIAGSAATFIFEQFEGEERRWISIGFMIIIFIMSIVIAKGMKIRLPRSDRKKIVTEAIGSYVFLYLFIWILTYTIFNAPGSESGLPTPFR
jgi:cytochrome bd-type quinol oxidase subunit 2